MHVTSTIGTDSIVGFRYADLTDSTDGGCLGAEYGFTAVASLDANPSDLKRLFSSYELTMTSVAAHANLLDPTAPFRYGTGTINEGGQIGGFDGRNMLSLLRANPPLHSDVGFSQGSDIFRFRETIRTVAHGRGFRSHYSS